MKYVFFGTPNFAAIILEKLLSASFVPEAIVCNPDRPVGRKKIITSPPTKILAEKHGIKVLQPEKLSAVGGSAFGKEVGEVDFAVVAAYAKIIPEDILDIPRLGTIGVHPSLLPRYRGPSPIQGAILGGDEETGVTLYLLDEKVDHGPIIAMKESIIRNQNYQQLLEELASLGGDLLTETLPEFLEGKIKPQKQDESEATYTKKFTTEDAFIRWDDLQLAIDGKEREKSIEIERKIRALNPEPGCWTIKTGKRIKLLEAELQDNKLVLKKIQAEGKNPAQASTLWQ